jgi:hypothetical protein
MNVRPRRRRLTNPRCRAEKYNASLCFIAMTPHFPRPGLSDSGHCSPPVTIQAVTEYRPAARPDYAWERALRRGPARQARLVTGGSRAASGSAPFLARCLP